MKAKVSLKDKNSWLPKHIVYEYMENLDKMNELEGKDKE